MHAKPCLLNHSIRLIDYLLGYLCLSIRQHFNYRLICITKSNANSMYSKFVIIFRLHDYKIDLLCSQTILFCK